MLTLLIITLGITFLFILKGIINGLQKEIVENLTKAEVGEIQITKEGYFEALPGNAEDYLFEYSDEIIKEIQSVPEVEALSGRLLFGGLINHQKNQITTPFFATAIEPEGEANVCPRLKDYIDKDKGFFLDSSKEKSGTRSAVKEAEITDAVIDESENYGDLDSISDPQNLNIVQDEYHQILIGSYMLKGFSNGGGEAKLEDELILMTKDINGFQRSLSARLTGVLEARNPMADKTIIYMTLKTAQDFLSAQNMVTQIVISVKDSDKRYEIADKLSEKLKKYNLTAQPWDNINKFFVNIMGLQNMFYKIITGVISLFVIAAIIITSLMTVAERTKEIGALMAIGYKRKHIIFLFLSESGFIGLGGGLMGVLFGLLLVLLLGHIGVPFQIPGTEREFLVRPVSTLPFTFFAFALGIASAVIGSLFPAKSASKLSPLEAMAHV